MSFKLLFTPRQTTWKLLASSSWRNMDHFSGILVSLMLNENQKNIIKLIKFINSHNEVLRPLRLHISGHDLVIPLKIKIDAYELLNSSWVSTIADEKFLNLICDKSFWDGVTIVVKATISLVTAISLINGDHESNMGSQYMSFWNTTDVVVWNGILHKPLHAAGYLLNPRLHFDDDFYSDTTVSSGLLVAVVRMVEDQHTQDQISQQLEIYGACAAEFKIGTDNNSQNTLSPVTWWSH